VDLLDVGDDLRCRLCQRQGLDVKAAGHQSLTASTTAGRVDRRRSRLVGMGEPATLIRRKTLCTGYTSRRSASRCDTTIQTTYDTTRYSLTYDKKLRVFDLVYDM